MAVEVTNVLGRDVEPRFSDDELEDEDNNDDDDDDDDEDDVDDDDDVDEDDEVVVEVELSSVGGGDSSCV